MALNLENNTGERHVYDITLGLPRTDAENAPGIKPPCPPSSFHTAMEELASRVSKVTGGVTYGYTYGTWDTSLSEATAVCATGGPPHLERDHAARFSVLVLRSESAKMLHIIRAEAAQVVRKYNLNVHHIQVVRTEATAHHFLVQDVQIDGSLLGESTAYNEPMPATNTVHEMDGRVVAAGMEKIDISSDTVMLDGHSLSETDAWRIAEAGAPVALAASAVERVQHAHTLLMEAVKGGRPVYGLTVGVGLNKDQKLFEPSGELSPEVLAASREFNRDALRSHSASIGPDAPHVIVRLAMIIRLNNLLHGNAGVQLAVVQMYEAFLTKDLVPAVPELGTVGEADILLAAHVGLVMLGEGHAYYEGKRMTGGAALQAAGLSPLDALGKDALSILSNNAFAVAYSLRAARAADRLLQRAPQAFALSLEAMNGNIAPFLPQTNSVRPFPAVQRAAASVMENLEGSFLLDHHLGRPLQDPLSFRTSANAIGVANKAVAELLDAIRILMNCSDDNPAVILDATASLIGSSQESGYIVASTAVDVKGGIFPTSNFNVLPLALAAQATSAALVHVSHNAAMRCNQLCDDHFTGLPRFLSAPGNRGHAFGAIHKVCMDMHSRNMHLAAPVSFYGLPVAGNIEDTFSNSKLVADNLNTLVHNLYIVLGVEAVLATQAVDLRRNECPSLTLGMGSSKLYAALRAKIAFVACDRPYTDDITNAAAVLMSTEAS